MRSPPLWLLCLAALTALPAAAQTQWMVGARAGVALPGDARLGPGPMAGLDATVRLHRLVALEAALEQSLHSQEVSQQTQDAWFTAWTLGVQYRLDVARVVPYGFLGVEGWRQATHARRIERGYGAAFALGMLVPLWDHLYWGAEARYGLGTDGAFPTRQGYLLRLGWRSHAF